MRPLWFLEEDADSAYEFGRMLLRDAKLGVQNTQELACAGRALSNATRSLTSSDVPLPDDFPPPRLFLPEKKFTPDYFIFGGYRFVSRQFRDALAQPEAVVQYVPCEVVGGNAESRAQDYRLLRVLAIQPAVDLERSECELEDFTNRWTGERTKRPRSVDRYALLADLVPKTEIFRMAEERTYVLTTDALAERVLRAGCTGMEFSDSANRQSGMRIDRYRTADGIGEHRVGFLD